MIETLTLSIRNGSHTFSAVDTKGSIIEKLGEPDDIGGFFGKKKIPLIQKYESVEFHYELDGSLRMIYQLGRNGVPYLCVPFSYENI